MLTRRCAAIVDRIGRIRLDQSWRPTFYFLLCFWIATWFSPGRSCGQQGPVQLEYKLHAGQTLTMRVEHFTDTYTIMAQQHEHGYSRTITQKQWHVEEVSPEGDATIVFTIAWVSLAQSVGEKEEVTYDSRHDEAVPREFEQVAKRVGAPLARVTINRFGKIIERDQDLSLPNLGMGELAVPLPEHPVSVGGSWDVPRQARVQLDNGAYKLIKIREHYTLEKVAHGVATIRVVSQPLTPIHSPSVESQLLQQLNQGTIKFDIDRGVVLSKRLDWDTEVVSFRGPNTSLRYQAKFEERLLSNQIPARTATKRSSSPNR